MEPSCYPRNLLLGVGTDPVSGNGWCPTTACRSDWRWLQHGICGQSLPHWTLQLSQDHCVEEPDYHNQQHIWDTCGVFTGVQDSCLQHSGEKNGLSWNSWHLSPFSTPLPLLPNHFQACLIPSFSFLSGEILITTACAGLHGLHDCSISPFGDP